MAIRWDGFVRAIQAVPDRQSDRPPERAQPGPLVLRQGIDMLRHRRAGV